VRVTKTNFRDLGRWCSRNTRQNPLDLRGHHDGGDHCAIGAPTTDTERHAQRVILHPLYLDSPLSSPSDVCERYGSR